jgi:hypothetical protein
LGRGRLRWGRFTGRLVLIRMRGSVSMMSMTHLMRAILGGRRPESRRLVATASFSALQPRQPSYTCTFASGDTLNQTSGTLPHTPFELAPLLIRSIRDGALEDRAKEQESPRTVVRVFVAHARPLQDIVYDLHAE